MQKLIYTSDTHFGHKNIIKLTDRPFDFSDDGLDKMNKCLLENLRHVEAMGYTICHMGDVAFNLRKFIGQYGWLKQPWKHLVVIGNHDPTKKQLDEYGSYFGVIVGSVATWQSHFAIVHDYADGKYWNIMLSHRPQENLHGCDLNLYGHLHNNRELAGENAHHAEDCWAWESPKHVNVCVENWNYKPVTLQEIFDVEGKRLSL